MDYVQAIVLGIVQGLTEWLPISSSGHLVIIQELCGIQVPLLFDIMLHFGTLLAVFAMFWKDLLKIVASIIHLDFGSEYGTLALFLVVGSIPVALVGALFHDFFKSLFRNLTAVGVALLITSVVLYSSKFHSESKTLNYKESFLVGIAQAIAIMPGISRSGFTIATGLLRGIDRREIFRFSFLLSIPAIIGANLFELATAPLAGFDLIGMIAGTLTAAVVGYLSLKLLLRLVVNRKFYLFSFYCLALGLLILVISFLVE
ncbi:MAG: undecaprenyl-diphosphate phosphatase [Methanophagales archaeon ANME-1-THS]|nr:MAG: undecaprenyl-diphosphate phosphatase [Methanophagales archaeon ANME-1-THS]